MAFPTEARDLLKVLSRAPGGRSEGLPRIDGMTGHEVEALLLDLVERGLIRVDGPPNQNSDLSKDVDSIQLTALGFRTAASL